MTIFKDLTDLEVIEQVSDLADDFEVVKEQGGYLAYVNGGWLPNTYNNEDEAFRQILAQIVGEKDFFNDEEQDEDDIRYCIRNVAERPAYLYWLDGHGWETENYSVFTNEEKKTYNLPDNGRWEEC